VLLQHWRFVEVVIGCEMMRTSVFRDSLYVFVIVAANIDVEKHHVTVDILLADQIFKILLNRYQRLGQTAARHFVPGIEREVIDRYTSIAQSVRYFGTEQPAVGADINPETLFRSVISHLVCEVGSKEWFTSHQSQHAAAVVVQPVDCASRGVFGHSFYFVVIGSAVPAVQVALVIEEEVSGYRMK